jgi:hypothetical protein
MNMRAYIVAFCALFLAAAFQTQAKADVCGSVAGNLVLNCGFESGDFTSWTLTGNDVPGELNNLYGVEGSDPFAGDPNSGTSQAFFSDLPANATTLSQTLATVVGQTYIVTFYLAEATEGPGTLSDDALVKFGASTVENLSNLSDQGYTKYTADIVATSGSTTLSFVMGNETGEFLVDDVSVAAATPEPATIPVIGGLLLVGAYFVRRRAAAASR